MTRVLIADDEAVILLHLEQALAPLGFEVVGLAGSAEQATALARELRPDVALIDVVLPGAYSGLDACRTIQEELDIPVVLMSGHSDATHLAQARAVRPRGYVVKPFSPGQVAAALLMALGNEPRGSAPAPAPAPAPVPKRPRRPRGRAGFQADLRLAEHCLAGVWILDRQGVTLSANRSLAEMLGLMPRQMVGRHCSEFLDRASQAETQRRLEKCLQGFSAQYDLCLRSVTGCAVWAICSHSPLPGPGGQPRGSLLVATNITYRKFAEASLLESESRFRQLVENLSEVFWITEFESGRGLYVSPSFQAVWGRTELDFLARPQVLRESAHPEDLARLAQARERFQAEHEPYCVEYRILRPDGQMRWVRTKTFAVLDASGRPYRAVGISEDITEPRRAARERDRLARAIEQVGDVVIITDPRGTIQYANPAFERISGQPRHSVLGRNMAMLESTVDDAVYLGSLQRALAGGETWNGRYSYQRPDGARREVRATLAPIYDQGRVAHYVSVQRDVTEEMQLEAQLHQARKMEALGTLAGGIAHDFNNILMAIMGFSELAMAEAPEDSRLRSRLRRVLQAGERARDLVRQILAFSRRGELERAPLELGPLVKETLALLRATLPANIAIRRDIDSQAGTTLADPGQIHQIVMNLCTNAAYALEHAGGGTLSVHLGRKTVAPGSPALPSGQWLALEVVDDGPGIPPDVLERVFDPFFTTKAPGEGTGMGLAVVHGTVHNLGGTVHVDSGPGRGARFTVLLPPAPPGESAQDGPVPPQLGGTERILYVDDENAIADLAAQTLGSLGYAVTACASPDEALTLLDSPEPPFDLLVTDQAMPGLTGLGLAREARRRHPGLPVILCTGFSRAASPQSLRRNGVARMLLKPFTLPDLARAIRTVLAAQGAAPGKR
jgi:PAS domain S-box-containing protein